MNARNLALVLATSGLLASSLCVAANATASDDESPNHFQAVGLVRTVIDNASKYRNIDIALADGYIQASGCVSGPDSGTMGVHFARLDLIGDGALDGATPEILVYEPTAWGAMRLVAVEYIAIKEAWEANNGVGAPAILEGQHTMLTGAPNRYGLPPHYMLHVWAFKHNRNGIFSAWNPNVSCQFYAP